MLYTLHVLPTPHGVDEASWPRISSLALGIGTSYVDLRAYQKHGAMCSQTAQEVVHLPARRPNPGSQARSLCRILAVPCWCLRFFRDMMPRIPSSLWCPILSGAIWSHAMQKGGCCYLHTSGASSSLRATCMPHGCSFHGDGSELVALQL